MDPSLGKELGANPATTLDPITSRNPMASFGIFDPGSPNWLRSVIQELALFCQGRLGSAVASFGTNPPDRSSKTAS